MRYFTGIDIGSTATKVVVLDETDLVDRFVLPTGWSSRETAAAAARKLCRPRRFIRIMWERLWYVTAQEMPERF